jgi:hypothetical protein
MTSGALTKQVLEQERSAAEYLAWVRTAIAAVKLEDDGIRKIRYREGLAKQLMYEALPIGLLATKYFSSSDQVRISLKVGSQPYDAEVHDQRTNGSTVRYLEVTMALEEEDDYLRMKVLHETGEVSGLTKVIKTRKRKTGLQFSVPREAVSQQEVLLREGQKLAEAIKRKVSKSYPAGTMLVIGFDDRMAFDHPENLANLESVVSTHRTQLGGFHSVAVIGMYKDLYLHWETSSAI